MFNTTPESVRAVMSERMREAEDYRRRRLMSAPDARPKKRRIRLVRWGLRRIVLGTRR